MNQTPSTSMKPMYLYSAIPTTTFASVALDTLDFDHGYATFVVAAAIGAGAAVTGLKVTECATSGGSYTAVTGATFTNVSTSNDGAAEIASVRIAPRLRFLKVEGIGGGANNSVITAIGVLTGASTSTSCDATFIAEV